ncbi:GntR family transcriptional regulator [Mycobacterium sp. djl-10]|nr:GntR family transcriptional regulator [Mycobacterium sp. djl-10]
MTTSETAPAVGGELLSTGVKRLLLDRIMSGYYKPGERIVELRLAKEQGISQSPIREALRDLAAIGLIEMHSRRGASVRVPTGAELGDVSLVRSEIDALAARIATPILSDKTLEELQAAYDEMVRCRAAGDIPGLTQADARFHRLIALASGNKAIERVFDQLEPFARTFITLTMPDIDVDVIMQEHLGILAALRDRNADLAATRARAHQLGVSEIFRRFDPASRIHQEHNQIGS